MSIYKINESVISNLVFTGGHLAIVRSGQGTIHEGVVLSPVMNPKCEVRIGPNREDRQVMQVDSRGLRALAEALVEAADHVDAGVTVPEAQPLNLLTTPDPECKACYEADRDYDPTKHDDEKCYAVDPKPADPWKQHVVGLPRTTDHIGRGPLLGLDALIEDDAAPMGWCMADPHRAGNGKRYPHIQNEGCFEWRPDPIED